MFKLKIINKPKMIKMKCNIEFPKVVLANFQEKEVTPTKEIQETKADQQYDGLSKVTVNPIPDEYIIPAGTLEITANGNYDIKKYETLTTNIHEPEPYKPRYISFYNYKGNSLDEEVSNLDTSLITSMFGMFQNCTKLLELDLSNFDTSNINNMSYMFNSCEKLEKLDIRSFKFDKVTSYYGMFLGDFPNKCLIIVKSDTEKEWITSKWTNLTNVKTVDELK